MTITLENWQRDPSIVAIVKATFPSYRREKILVWHTNHVILMDLNWSGGTRKEYRACTLDGTAGGATAKYHALAPWSPEQVEGAKVEVPQGCVLVEGGSFCGKESILYLHVNPHDLPKWIAAAKHLQQSSRETAQKAYDEVCKVTL